MIHESLLAVLFTEVVLVLALVAPVWNHAKVKAIQTIAASSLGSKLHYVHSVLLASVAFIFLGAPARTGSVRAWGAHTCAQGTACL